jgi:hypothetical protein
MPADRRRNGRGSEFKVSSARMRMFLYLDDESFLKQKQNAVHIRAKHSEINDNNFSTGERYSWL